MIEGISLVGFDFLEVGVFFPTPFGEFMAVFTLLSYRTFSFLIFLLTFTFGLFFFSLSPQGML